MKSYSEYESTEPLSLLYYLVLGSVDTHTL